LSNLPSSINTRQQCLNAQVQMMANVGHAAFWEDAAGFNERLRAFCESLESHGSPD
jgi:pimeloyl-ACP methyl ester carboxylesterase